MDAVVEEVCVKLGYNLKDEQRKVILSFVKGEDVFVVLPTGFGKSLCFTCLPLIFDRVREDGLSSIIIITPLIAIMKDQVRAFTKKGLTVGCVCGEDDDQAMKADIAVGKFQLVYFAPEVLLLNSRWRKVLLSDKYQLRIKGLVINEAHTLKNWGTTFRQELLKVGELRSLPPEMCRVMALTVTASYSLCLELANIIGMKKPTAIILPLCKANLSYSRSQFISMESHGEQLQFISMESNFTPVLEKLKKERTYFPRTIVYCRTMENCANLYIFFQQNMGPSFIEPPAAPPLSRFRMVEMYTSCTDEDIKSQIVESFTRSSCLRIICATVAFGMGVNCPDVREVVHLGPPNDIESYILQFFNWSGWLASIADKKRYPQYISILLFKTVL